MTAAANAPATARTAITTGFSTFRGTAPTKFSNVQCSLDAIDGAPAAAAAPTMSGALVTFGGWVGNGQGKPGRDFLLVIQRERRAYAVPLRLNVTRDDVAKALKSAAMTRSGFNVQASLRGVPNGTYTIYFADPADRMADCDAERRLVVGSKTIHVTVDWAKTVTKLQTVPTMQVVYNPLLNKSSKIHRQVFSAIRSLGADYVRFVPWFPYPHEAVPELYAPTSTRTFWDFRYIDPVVQDFMHATKGHAVLMNFSTIPNWMFSNGKTITVPKDPDSDVFSYNQGTNLKDMSGRGVARYYASILQWYTKGGFVDELGRYHRSKYHYKFPYWEVLNEVGLERAMTPQEYTRIYDAIVSRLVKISPDTKFIGLSLAFENDPSWFTYFLNHKNHKHNVPIDGISFHFYASPVIPNSTIHDWQYSFFKQANGFLAKVGYIKSIKDRLSPKTFIDVDEIGTMIGGKDGPSKYAANYWNLSAALYAYIYVGLSLDGVKIAGESQFVGLPGQFPSLSMVNWSTGEPNAKYSVLKLLVDKLSTEDRLVETSPSLGLDAVPGGVVGQAIVAPRARALLLINVRDWGQSVVLPTGLRGGRQCTESVVSGGSRIRSVHLRSRRIDLSPFAVAFVQCVR